MKQINQFIFLVAILLNSLLLLNCGTQKSVEKNENTEMIDKLITDFDFKFTATYAYPQNYKSIYLTPYYDVKVSPDTITAYLPYYGRVYSAPYPLNEGGIKFESTEFDYEVKEGKKKGNWDITIKTKDTQQTYTLYFNLWSNGTGSLDVQSHNRQPISFQGAITSRPKM